MRSAAEYGPVVVINSSWMGVEAIIIQEHQLMSKAFMEIKDFQKLKYLPEHEYGSVETLETLWNAFISHVHKSRSRRPRLHRYASGWTGLASYLVGSYRPI